MNKENDLFNNPMVDSALAAMSPEDVEKYQKAGEYMHETVDFVNADGKKETAPAAMMNGVMYILDSLRSGQHISTLESNEKRLLKETYGDEWYSVLGYTKEDVTNMVTFPLFGKKDEE
jgi:hypothetical protein